MILSCPTPNQDFQHLEPNLFLKEIEITFGQSLTGLCRPYNSYINRVFEIATTEGKALVVKFYRPGRWSKEAILEEHEFLIDLKQAEIPVIAPIAALDGKTLACYQTIPYSLFEKRGGRSCDELKTDDWITIGRLLGQIHQVGVTKKAKNRLVWHPEFVTKSQIASLLKDDVIPEYLKQSFQKTCDNFLSVAIPLFKNVELIRIHGDLHFANLIYRPGENFTIIDFDDMAMGPASQDMWMLLPGYTDETYEEKELFIEGYETFREFPRQEWKLPEVLRGMRYIHFMSWWAKQKNDGGFLQTHPNYGTESYWRKEMEDLELQTERILKMGSDF